MRLNSISNTSPFIIAIFLIATLLLTTQSPQKITGLAGGDFSASAITVSSCMVINESVTLTQNIAIATQEGCFHINQSNIFFNCAGFIIKSNPPSNFSAFNITSTTEMLNNITVKDCNIFNFTIGVNATNVYGINLTNINFTNGTIGIRFNNVSHSIINNVSIGINNTGFWGNAVYFRNVTNTSVGFVAVPEFGSAFSSLNFPVFDLVASNKNYLNNNSVPSSGSNALALTTSSNNTFVGNVFISTLSGGGGKAGALVQTASQNNTFKYNNFSAGRNSALDICTGCDNTTLIGNLATITNSAGGSSFVIASAFSLIENNSVSGIAGNQLSITGENNTISNNTANMSGSGGNSAITVSGGNNLIIKNQLFSTGGMAIEVSTVNGNNNQFINNTCSSNADSGIETTGGGRKNNNTFTGNFCQSTTYGVSLMSAENYTFTNNTFKGRVGVLIGSVNPVNSPGARHTNFINTTVIGDTGFEINESTNITITNTSFQDTNWSIKSKWNSNISLIDNQRVTNYSFNSSKVLISMTGLSQVYFWTFIIANGTNLSMDVNLTSNKVHVNTTRTAGLNSSANITLFNQAKSVIQVSYDGSNFETCPATVCSTPVISGSDTIFNVSHFTDFQGLISGDANITITKTDNPQTITAADNINYTITINNTGNLSAFNVTLTENYPTGTSFVSASPSPTDGSNVWNLSTLTTGTQTVINITISVPASISGNITNSINVSYNNASGVLLVVNTTQNTTVNPAPPPAPSGASPGGGSRINFKSNPSKSFMDRIELSKTEIVVNLAKGQPTSEVLKITNKAQSVERLKLEVPQDIIQTQSSLINLLPGESKSLKLSITAPESKDTDTQAQIKIINFNTNEEQIIRLTIKIIKETNTLETKITPKEEPPKEQELITTPIQKEEPKNTKQVQLEETSPETNEKPEQKRNTKTALITTMLAILTVIAFVLFEKQKKRQHNN